MVVVTAAAATAVILWTAAAAGGGDTVRVYSSRDTEGGGMDGSADSIESAWKPGRGEEREEERCWWRKGE